MKVAIIGLGEVGLTFAEALVAAGIAVPAACARRPSPEVKARAAAAGITLHGAVGPWLAGADVVISAVVGGAAVAVAQAAMPHMTRGAVYADFTTARPQDMQAAAAVAEGAGLLFADVAIMGGVTLAGARTPLLCAGPGAARLAELLAPLHGEIRVLPDSAAGDAVALKLLRSVFVKGMEALAVECLTLAESKGLRRALYDNLADIDRAALPDFLDMLVRTHVIHAARRRQEVESAEAQLRETGFEPRVTAAVESVFARTCRATAGQAIDPAISVQDALALLMETARAAPVEA